MSDRKRDGDSWMVGSGVYAGATCCITLSWDEINKMADFASPVLHCCICLLIFGRMLLDAIATAAAPAGGDGGGFEPSVLAIWSALHIYPCIVYVSIHAVRQRQRQPISPPLSVSGNKYIPPPPQHARASSAYPHSHLHPHPHLHPSQNALPLQIPPPKKKATHSGKAKPQHATPRHAASPTPTLSQAKPGQARPYQTKPGTRGGAQDVRKKKHQMTGVGFQGQEQNQGRCQKKKKWVALSVCSSVHPSFLTPTRVARAQPAGHLGAGPKKKKQPHACVTKKTVDPRSKAGKLNGEEGRKKRKAGRGKSKKKKATRLVSQKPEPQSTKAATRKESQHCRLHRRRRRHHLHYGSHLPARTLQGDKPF
ncbi:hypothetical protein BS50DRAFT_161784 [Corynespora cassiicola Philippines]|uniref:Uncharacterized protein n=1 Tax=Corynespora cassiicola Philippines TaxID=1448308 RepID=A0A2T2N6D9_CORCC|nr:hypothetical protein BS50DRAFT_161784 [Corynespora cassiicola Philippines]